MSQGVQRETYREAPANRQTLSANELNSQSTAKQPQTVSAGELFDDNIRIISPLRITAIMLASRVVARSARVAAPRFAAVTTRSFADVKTASTKPPVELFGIDGTYASALVRPMAPSISHLPSRNITNTFE